MAEVLKLSDRLGFPFQLSLVNALYCYIGSTSTSLMYFARVTCANMFTSITFEIQVCLCRHALPILSQP
jgi:hypothetical protein